MKFYWQNDLLMFQNVNLRNSSNIGTPIKHKKMAETNTKNRKKLKNPHTAGKISFALVRNDLAEMEEIEKQQSVDGSESIDAFSLVMGPEHPGRLCDYMEGGGGVTKSSLKRKAGNSETVSTATNDAVQQMQERIQKMEEQMDEQRRTIQQDVTTNIISQLQREGLINADVLAALCFH